MTKPFITPRDEKKKILGDPTLARAIRKLIEDNIRLAALAHKILLQRLRNEPGKFNGGQLNMVYGTALYKLPKLLKIANEQLKPDPYSAGKVCLEESWKAGLAIEQGRREPI